MLKVLDGGVEVEFDEALEAYVAALFPLGLLALEEQGEPVVEGVLGDVEISVCSPAGGEDGLDGPVAKRADGQREVAGGLQDVRRSRGATGS